MAAAAPVLAKPVAALEAVAGNLVVIPFINTGGGGLNAQSDSTPGCAVDPVLPSGLSIIRVDGGLTCLISGIPSLGRGAERLEYTVTATNAQGSSSATVTISIHPDELAQALGTHLVMEQFGTRGWTVAPTAAKGGTAAAASGAANSNPRDGEEGRSCLSTEVNLPGHYSFEWKGAQGQGGLVFGIGDASHSLPATGEWESVYDEMAPGGGSSFVRLSWCHPGDAAGAHLDNILFTRAPVGLEAAPASATQVNLRWEEYPNATYYTVLRGSRTDGSDATEISTPMMQTTTSFADTGLTAGATYHYQVIACSRSSCTGRSLSAAATPAVADSDADGLIDIGTPSQLHSVRHDLAGASLKASAHMAGNSDGCPSAGCSGYELSANISFDADGDGATWSRPSAGAPTLDFGDHHHRHFNVFLGGWIPIGDCGADDSCTGTDDNTSFAATFDGANRTITGLAILGDHKGVGLFGSTDSGADIRSLGLVGNLAGYTGQASTSIGGLAGHTRHTSVTACYATGDAVASPSGSNAMIGGLVGSMSDSSITASFASGSVTSPAEFGGQDAIGGLVGSQLLGSSITASYATGNVDAGGGGQDFAGGLVGRPSASITASYATGNVDGGKGNTDSVGGLVGWQEEGTITASYATGNVDGGAGSSDMVGALAGNPRGTTTDSWGFGDETGGEDDGSDGSGTPPATQASGLTIGAGANTDVPDTWNQASSNTLNAWDDGTAQQPPRLQFADYDGSDDTFHCAGEPSPPSSAILIPSCNTPLPSPPAP